MKLRARVWVLRGARRLLLALAARIPGECSAELDGKPCGRPAHPGTSLCLCHAIAWDKPGPHAPGVCPICDTRYANQLHWAARAEARPS
jgi:hypothetical protein